MKPHHHLKQFKLRFASIGDAIALLTPLVLVAGNCDRVLAQQRDWTWRGDLAVPHAQIIPDDNLGGEASVVTPNVEIKGLPADRIDGGAIRDSNLFHSFQEFNIGDLQRVYFANPEGITNIFSRVTGSNLSEIFGTLGVNGNANLFFINPNGIIFGENASLDVGGSFAASTANAIQFGDRGLFSATEPETPPLLTVKPSAFFSNQINGGAIVVNGADLQVSKGRSLLLMGSKISLNGGKLKVGEGNIDLAAIASDQSIGITENSKQFNLSISPDLELEDISIFNQAKVDVSGEAGGAIAIYGKQINITEESELTADTLGSKQGRGITFQGSQLIIQEGAQISASGREESSGISGGIEVNTSDSVQLIGTSEGGGGGRGGNGNGNNRGNNNNSEDGEKPSKLASDARGSGQAGDLIINTQRLILQDGAKISASTVEGDDGGNIVINAPVSVELIGTSRIRDRSSGISVQTRGDGIAGDITVNTGKLIVREGAEISASTFGQGDGGDIAINATESVSITGTSPTNQLFSRLIAETGGRLDSRDVGLLIGKGKGGNLNINTRELTIEDKAIISVSSQNLESKDAGNLEIKANSITLAREGQIIGTTKSGEGGNINLEVEDLLLLRDRSQISTTAGDEQFGGNGGDINIDADLIVAIPQENSDITANAFAGDGGNIQIDTENIFGLALQENSNLSDITASSQFGLDGTVNINTSGIEPVQELIELPIDIVDVSKLINQNLCLAGQEGEFIITGKGGLSTAPQDTLNTDAGWEDWRIVDNSESNNQQSSHTPSLPEVKNGSSNQIVVAQGWYIAPKGNIVLTADEPVKSVSRSSSSFSFHCQLIDKLQP